MTNAQKTALRTEKMIRDMIVADGGVVESINIFAPFIFVRVPETSKPQIKRFFKVAEERGMIENIEYSFDEEIAEIKMSASIK
ncbi:MAG: hypothetical protein CL529_11985 [Aequorivita sp.]|nr:hypothetical protein [Aequorivita sp.]|tara:strand:+ start:30671 stop:30919 length:249 start_codon:yes stop_codon:yes gene_type:complete